MAEMPKETSDKVAAEKKEDAQKDTAPDPPALARSDTARGV
jgi:hypothetical protein